MMPENENQFEGLGRLIAALLDGGLEEADRRRLEEILAGDPAAMKYYQDYLDVHVLLHWQGGVAEAPRRAANRAPRSRPPSQGTVPFLLTQKSGQPPV